MTSKTGVNCYYHTEPSMFKVWNTQSFVSVPHVHLNGVMLRHKGYLTLSLENVLTPLSSLLMNLCC
jgi:hypothetical protein